MKAAPISKYAHRLTHGETRGRSRTPEWSTWDAMLARCYNPKRPNYKYYGGRGITVCDRWRNDFSAFLADMGRRPSDKHSLERIDNNKGYSPENCRWALPHEQAANRRQRGPLAALAREHKIHVNTLRIRLQWGWTLEDALTRPVKKYRIFLKRPT